MTAWFGPRAWGAPILKDIPRVGTPIGDECHGCHHPIAVADEGFIMPLLTEAGTTTFIAFHEDCYSYRLIGSPWCGDSDVELRDPRHARYHELRDGGMRPRAAIASVQAEFPESS